MGASVSVDVSFTVSIVVGVSVSVVVSDNIWVRVRVRVRVDVVSTESELLHWRQHRVDKNATRGQCLSALAHPFLKFREGICKKADTKTCINLDILASCLQFQTRTQHRRIQRSQQQQKRENKIK